LTDAPEKARILVDLLAKDLTEHLIIVGELEDLSRKVREALPSSQALREQVEEKLASLALLRDAISEKSEVLLGLVEDEQLPEDVLRDVYALSGYYVEAGSKSERAVLERLQGFGASGDDLERVSRARESVSKLYSAASRKYRGRAPRGQA